MGEMLFQLRKMYKGRRQHRNSQAVLKRSVHATLY